MREINKIFSTETPIKTLGEYIDTVNEITNNLSDKLWFRGQSKSDYKLLPSIYRDIVWEDGNYDYQTEFNAFKDFKRRSDFVDKTDYDYLHLMQHYGLSTRLLDWTESSLIALFFAIQNTDNCENPIVWAINPWDFNDKLHNTRLVYDFYGDKPIKEIQNYIYPKDGKFENLPSKPIAVLPSFYDARVIAQKSTFVLFGKDKVPIEQIVDQDDYFDMAKIQIDTESVDELKIDLELSGITYHTIYPDIEGLVKDIKRKWGLK